LVATWLERVISSLEDGPPPTVAALFTAKEVRALIGAQHEVCTPRSADREEVLATGEEWTNGMAERVALMST
jgi:hypothetical protein